MTPIDVEHQELRRNLFADDNRWKTSRPDRFLWGVQLPVDFSGNRPCHASSLLTWTISPLKIVAVVVRAWSPAGNTGLEFAGSLQLAVC